MISRSTRRELDAMTDDELKDFLLGYRPQIFEAVAMQAKIQAGRDEQATKARERWIRYRESVFEHQERWLRWADGY